MSLIASATPSALDKAALLGLPVACVPIESPFEPLTSGQRLLVAADGLYLEAASPTLYARLPLAVTGTPWGTTSPCVTLKHGKIPASLGAELGERALDAHPHEMASLIVVDAAGHYRLVKPAQSVTAASVSYADTDYPEGSLVIDAHSHGAYPATFSVTDDDSDRSRLEPHISFVYGYCDDRTRMALTGRVCVGHYLIPLDHAVVTGLFA